MVSLITQGRNGKWTLAKGNPATVLVLDGPERFREEMTICNVPNELINEISDIGATWFIEIEDYANPFSVPLDSDLVKSILGIVRSGSPITLWHRYQERESVLSVETSDGEKLTDMRFIEALGFMRENQFLVLVASKEERYVKYEFLSRGTEFRRLLLAADWQ